MKIKYKILFIAMLLMGISLSSKSQQISRAEYFFDSDPGVGNAEALTIPAGDTLETTFSIPIDGLESGFHQLYIRVAGEDNLWSLFEGRTFYILSPSPTPQDGSPIADGEYFFDADPGIGNGTPLNFTGGDTINTVFNLDVASLTTGFHQLYIRFKDANNKWSLFEGRTLYVLQSAEQSPSPKLVALEYFTGEDPGMGNGTEITFAMADTISMNTLIDIASRELSAGEYQLSMRVKDANGTWSHTKSRRFYICGSIPEVPVVYDGMVCGEGTVQLAAEGAGEGNYRWYNTNEQFIEGATDSLYTTPNLTDSATYFVTVVNAEGCESDKQPVLAAVIKMEVEAGENDTLTYAQDTVTLEPGEPAHGKWYGSNAVVDSVNFDLSAGSGSYELSYEVDVHGCKFSDTRTVVVEKAKQAITFETLPDITFDQGPVKLLASSNSDLPVSFILSEGYGTINGEELAIDSTGIFSIHVVQDGNSNYLAADTVTRSFTVSKGAASISLSDLNPTYDGTGKVATVETTPVALNVSVLYENVSGLPVDAGEYKVVATVEDRNYEGYKTDTLRIAKAMAGIEFGNLTQEYDGNAKMVDVAVTPDGIEAEILYDGTEALPVNSGKYEVVATIQDDNYEGSLSDWLEIIKATASITLSDLGHIYDGGNKAAGVQTEPSGLSVVLLYDDSETLPVNAGEYEVSANVDELNWQGTTIGVLTIQKKSAAIEISGLEHEYDGNAKEVTITTSPEGLSHEVTYDGLTLAPVDIGTYEVKAEITENNYEGSEMEQMIIYSDDETGVFNLASGFINIYPNPTRSVLCVRFTGLYGQCFSCQLIDSNGKLIFKKNDIMNNNKEQIDMSKFAPGLYFLKIQIGNQIVIKKIIRY